MNKDMIKKKYEEMEGSHSKTESEIIKGLSEILKDIKTDDGVYAIPREIEDKVKDFINLNAHSNIENLRTLRNYLVLTIHNDFKEDYSNLRQNQMMMTVVTGMIDNKIWNLGGAV